MQPPWANIKRSSSGDYLVGVIGFLQLIDTRVQMLGRTDPLDTQLLSRSRLVCADNSGRHGIAEVVSAPASPWQNPYAERLIGSVRRECLNHVIVISERHLRRILSAYLSTTMGPPIVFVTSPWGHRGVPQRFSRRRRIQVVSRTLFWRA